MIMTGVIVKPQMGTTAAGLLLTCVTGSDRIYSCCVQNNNSNNNMFKKATRKEQACACGHAYACSCIFYAFMCRAFVDLFV